MKIFLACLILALFIMCPLTPMPLQGVFYVGGMMIIISNLIFIIGESTNDSEE